MKLIQVNIIELSNSYRYKYETISIPITVKEKRAGKLFESIINLGKEKILYFESMEKMKAAVKNNIGKNLNLLNTDIIKRLVRI
jgi:hypothetical protein